MLGTTLLRAAQAFEIALEALRTDRVRTRAAVVALGIAMAIVVCLATLVERGRAATVRALEEAGLSNVYLVNRVTDATKKSSTRRLTVEDVERAGALCGARSSSAVRVGRKDFVFRGAPFSVPVYAVAGNLRGTLGARSRRGRLLGDMDVDRKSPYCVVGSEVATLARLPEALGSVISADGSGYQIVGELSPSTVELSGTSEIPSIEWNRAVVVPLGAEPGAALEADHRYPIDFAVLQFDSLRDAEAAARELDLRAAEDLDRSSYRVASPLQTLRQYKASRRTFDRLIWLVCLLTGASAVFGVSNQLSASVIARTREIGIRRAVGARIVDVVLQFQAEGILLGVAGGGLGLLVGAAVGLLTADRTTGGGSLSLASFAALAVACGAIGILTGIRPAARAARVEPAAALREG